MKRKCTYFFFLYRMPSSYYSGPQSPVGLVRFQPDHFLRQQPHSANINESWNHHLHTGPGISYILGCPTLPPLIIYRWHSPSQIPAFLQFLLHVYCRYCSNRVDTSLPEVAVILQQQYLSACTFQYPFKYALYLSNMHLVLQPCSHACTGFGCKQ